VLAYTVKEGDTISAIADAHGVSVETLVQANDLESEDDLSIGQELRVLPTSGSLHVVQEGDTLQAIADSYGVAVETVLEANGLDNPDSLAPTQELVVPGAQPVTRGLLASRSGVRQQLPLKPSTYVVQPGDSLGAIADRFGISVETMLWANDVDDPDSIQPGFELTVLPVSGVLYTVQPGDTLIGISERFDVTSEEVLMANGIDDPASLNIGDKLLLPGGAPIQPTPTPVPPKPTPVPTPKPQPTPKPTATPAAEPTAAAPAPAAAAPEPTPVPTEAPAPPPAPAAPAETDGGEQIVAVAREFLGYPYVWGGTSPSVGFDCTGFVYYLFNKRLGIGSTRDLWGQLNGGTRVSRAQVQAGDLVFFQNTYQPGLSHVGIAIDNSTFIHAASERYGVMVSKLNDAYWSARWFGASRY
jgi:peptidoglycan endopeptidase LytE